MKREIRIEIPPEARDWDERWREWYTRTLHEHLEPLRAHLDGGITVTLVPGPMTVEGPTHLVIEYTLTEPEGAAHG